MDVPVAAAPRLSGHAFASTATRPRSTDAHADEQRRAHAERRRRECMWGVASPCANASSRRWTCPARRSATPSIEPPVAITVHFTPTLNLMWPAGIGGQEIHWDSTHSAYILDEPSHRFRGVVLSRQIVRHDEWQNATHGAELERELHASPSRAPAGGAAIVSFAGSSAPNEDPAGDRRSAGVADRRNTRRGRASATPRCVSSTSRRRTAR